MAAQIGRWLPPSSWAASRLLWRGLVAGVALLRCEGPGQIPLRLFLLSSYNSFFIGRSLSAAQVVDHHFGRAKALFAAAIAALENVQHGEIRLRLVAARGDGFLAVRVKGLAKAFLRLNAMTTQEVPELLKRHLHAFAEMFRRSGLVACQRAFEIVDHRQQFADKRFLLRRSAALGFLRSPFSKVVKIGGQPHIKIPLSGQVGFERLEIAEERLLGLLFRRGHVGTRVGAGARVCVHTNSSSARISSRNRWCTDAISLRTCSRDWCVIRTMSSGPSPSTKCSSNTSRSSLGQVLIAS